MSTATSSSSSAMKPCAVPNGSSFIALKPLATTFSAAAPKASGGAPSGPVPAVRVAGHRLADAAADERVHGQADGLAQDVPAGSLDRGDRMLVEVAGCSFETLSNRLLRQGGVGRAGSSPIARCSSSWTAVSMVRTKPFSVPSPSPLRPSSVWTRTNSQFFQPAPTVIVSIRVILIG